MTISSQDAQVLKILEAQLEKPIPKNQIILDKNRIVGLWLFGRRDLKSLPESFGNLDGLRDLKLSNTKLKTLPESFGNLSQLEKLDLSYTWLTALPESFGRLINLKILIFYGFSLPTIPDSFTQLRNLERLVLGEYQVSDFPEPVVDQLKSQGCRIFVKSRDIADPYGDDYETTTYELE